MSSTRVINAEKRHTKSFVREFRTRRKVGVDTALVRRVGFALVLKRAFADLDRLASLDLLGNQKEVPTESRKASTPRARGPAYQRRKVRREQELAAAKALVLPHVAKTGEVSLVSAGLVAAAAKVVSRKARVMVSAASAVIIESHSRLVSEVAAGVAAAPKIKSLHIDPEGAVALALPAQYRGASRFSCHVAVGARSVAVFCASLPFRDLSLTDAYNPHIVKAGEALTVGGQKVRVDPGNVHPSMGDPLWLAHKVVNSLTLQM